MSHNKDAIAAAREAKRARNRRDHQRSTAEGDHVLLRLDRGGASQLDQLAALAGLSRAAFARMFLPALLGALGPRLQEIEAARAATGQSLGAFLSRGLDEALAQAATAPKVSASTAAEFDELFR
jgi:hypothetical protein